MKVYRDNQEIKRKEGLGRRISLIGLGVLMLGLVVSFTPNWYPPDEPVEGVLGQFLQTYWVYVSFVALPVGFICANIGSYFVNRFARRRWPGAKYLARPDEVMERSLKGLDDKYAYFCWSLPPNYVLVGPCGILTFAVRGDKGRVIVKGDRWREPFSIGRIFTILAREGVGNPRVESEDHQKKIRDLLSQEEEGQFDDVPIDSAAVFLNQNIVLDLDGPSIPVLRADQVKGFVRQKAKEVKLQTSKLRALTRYLEEQSDHNEFDEE